MTLRGLRDKNNEFLPLRSYEECAAIRLAGETKEMLRAWTCGLVRGGGDLTRGQAETVNKRLTGLAGPVCARPASLPTAIQETVRK